MGHCWMYASTVYYNGLDDANIQRQDGGVKHWLHIRCVFFKYKPFTLKKALCKKFFYMKACTLSTSLWSWPSSYAFSNAETCGSYWALDLGCMEDHLVVPSQMMRWDLVFNGRVWAGIIAKQKYTQRAAHFILDRLAKFCLSLTACGRIECVATWRKMHKQHPLPVPNYGTHDFSELTLSA